MVYIHTPMYGRYVSWMFPGYIGMIIRNTRTHIQREKDLVTETSIYVLIERVREKEVDTDTTITTRLFTRTINTHG